MNIGQRIGLVLMLMAIAFGIYAMSLVLLEELGGSEFELTAVITRPFALFMIGFTVLLVSRASSSSSNVVIKLKSENADLRLEAARLQTEVDKLRLKNMNMRLSCQWTLAYFDRLGLDREDV